MRTGGGSPGGSHPAKRQLSRRTTARAKTHLHRRAFDTTSVRRHRAPCTILRRCLTSRHPEDSHRGPSPPSPGAAIGPRQVTTSVLCPQSIRQVFRCQYIRMFEGVWPPRSRRRSRVAQNLARPPSTRALRDGRVRARAACGPAPFWCQTGAERRRRPDRRRAPPSPRHPRAGDEAPLRPRSPRSSVRPGTSRAGHRSGRTP